MGEAELVTRFAAGEPGSVAAVYRTYGRLVSTVAYQVLGDAGLAAVATRRTFVEAWQLAASFDPDRELGPWLATIAGRTAIDIDQRNRESRRPAAPAITEPEPVGSTHLAEKVHDVWLIRSVLDALSGQDRELIRLQHDAGLSPTEISDRLGIPLDRVKSESYRAHRRFDGLLGQLRAGRAAATPPGRAPRSPTEKTEEGARR